VSGLARHPSGAEAHFSPILTARLKPSPFKAPRLSQRAHGGGWMGFQICMLLR
jgi:hypothetical protein